MPCSFGSWSTVVVVALWPSGEAPLVRFWNPVAVSFFVVFDAIMCLALLSFASYHALVGVDITTSHVVTASSYGCGVFAYTQLDTYSLRL